MRRALIVALWVGCAGPTEQSAACVRYVDCIGARDAALGIQTDVARFAAGGDCWRGAEGAELCTNGCENGLALMALDEVAGALPECVE